MTPDIRHIPQTHRFETTVNGFTAFVNYQVVNGALDILHTIVPVPIEGQGIASALVREAYEYAKSNGLKCKATCSYAVAWLRRNPTFADESV